VNPAIILYANFCRRMGATDAPEWDRLGAGFQSAFREDAAVLQEPLREIIDALEAFDTKEALRVAYAAVHQAS
jgi:hypothetical protein